MKDMDDNLKQDRGSRLPIKVNTDWGAYELKNAVFEKFKRYNKSVASHVKSDYKLIYKSGDIIQKIPGTEIDFTIKRYKEDLGVGYYAIHVYLMLYDEETEFEDDDFPTPHLNRPSPPLNNQVAEASSLSSTPQPSFSQASDLDLFAEADGELESQMAASSERYQSPFAQIPLQSNLAAVNTPFAQASVPVSLPNAQLFESSTISNSNEPIPQLLEAPVVSQPSQSTASDTSEPIDITDNDITDITDNEVQVTKRVTIHRLRIREEIIELFMEKDSPLYNFRFVVLDPRGREEPGVGIGVSRDVMCTFFQEVITSYTLGSEEVVPAIRHTMTKAHWKAIARAIVYSLKIGYYPLQISKAFMISVLFGEENVDAECLEKSFWNYLAVVDKDLIESMLNEYNDEEENTLLEILSSYNCYKRPSPENLKEILRELAHQEIIQRPKYVANAFSDVFRRFRIPDFESAEKVSSFYEQRAATPRRVIKHLSFLELSESQKQVSLHLQRFVKSLNTKDLKKFLRFITGGDLMPLTPISVRFTDCHPRAPRARTCTPQLELQDSYTCYNELAEEFTNILQNPESFSFSYM